MVKAGERKFDTPILCNRWVTILVEDKMTLWEGTPYVISVYQAGDIYIYTLYTVYCIYTIYPPFESLETGEAPASPAVRPPNHFA
jgi:hypothetical protein